MNIIIITSTIHFYHSNYNIKSDHLICKKKFNHRYRAVLFGEGVRVHLRIAAMHLMQLHPRKTIAVSSHFGQRVTRRRNRPSKRTHTRSPYSVANLKTLKIFNRNSNGERTQINTQPLIAKVHYKRMQLAALALIEAGIITSWIILRAGAPYSSPPTISNTIINIKKKKTHTHTLTECI